MEIGKVPPALVDVEPVAEEERVRHREADVGNGQLVDEPAVGPVEQRYGGKRRGIAERQRAGQVVQRQTRVDDLVDEDDVPTFDLRVEVLEEPNPLVAARLVRA